MFEDTAGETRMNGWPRDESTAAAAIDLLLAGSPSSSSSRGSSSKIHTHRHRTLCFPHRMESVGEKSGCQVAEDEDCGCGSRINRRKQAVPRPFKRKAVSYVPMLS